VAVDIGRSLATVRERPHVSGMPKAKRPSSEKIDHESAQSFPASDPPSWTLGARQESQMQRQTPSQIPSPTPPPGSLTAPAPRAAVSASPEADVPVDLDEGPSPALLAAQSPRAIPVASLLLWAGGLATAAAFALTLLARDKRWGRAFGQASVGLLLLGVASRSGGAAAGGFDDALGPSYH
jgi:hypothetical protein